MKIQVIISLIVAIATNLTVVGLHYAQSPTEWILTIASIACMLWFFIVVFVALFKEIKAS
jgi:hypothetical protein